MLLGSSVMNFTPFSFVFVFTCSDGVVFSIKHSDFYHFHIRLKNCSLALLLTSFTTLFCFVGNSITRLWITISQSGKTCVLFVCLFKCLSLIQFVSQ